MTKTISNKTIILLDIDGVLNFLGSPKDSFEIIKHDWGKWTIRKPVKEWLVSLSLNEKVTIMWLSSWGEESNSINKYLSIERFDTCLKNNTSNILRVKGKAILDLVYKVTNTQIIVIDDDYNSERENQELVSELQNTVNEVARRQSNLVYFITPNPYIGLSEEELKTINAIVETN